MVCDNEAGRHIVVNMLYHERKKHVDVDCYFVRESVNNVDVIPCPIWSEFQSAYIFTKALGDDCVKFMCNKLGVRDLHIPT